MAVAPARYAPAADAGKDRAFMEEAAAAGMAEVELGKLAVQKATSPDVKSFAQMMVDDHTKANEELKALAARQNVTLPPKPTAEHTAARERLSQLSGAAFDAAYMEAMVTDHNKAVALFSQESKDGVDPDAKTWAIKTLPTLQRHQAKAAALAQGSATDVLH
jgi:putative membrane protein